MLTHRFVWCAARRVFVCACGQQEAAPMVLAMVPQADGAWTWAPTQHADRAGRVECLGERLTC